MKHYIRFIYVFMLVFISACTNNEPSKNETTAKHNEQLQKVATEKKLPRDMNNPPFTKFELEADYGANKSYEAEYDALDTQDEAEIEDFINQKLIKGQAAAEIIRNNLKIVEIDEKTPNQQAVDQIIEAFHLEHTYKAVKIEVQFPSGKEKTYIAKR
ncbi:YusW family protein [Bacillus sp. 165]|uniref:YusW family protein n=1 Tax=Bacillus sp. 165 TaxID=1529117 RepID=UPI001ADD24B1|nr:YusW family protein [Bacillus sp. 165]MBO9128375.1 YusW family protein [Bacillus sp. 165]